MTTDSPIAFLKLKADDAQKLGRNGGDVSYLILTDIDRQQLYITISGNSGGGYYSNEIVSLTAVEACLPADSTQPIAAKSLAAAFVGKSANNPSFMAAILRSEGLLGPVESKPNQHQLAGDWSVWKSAMLASEGLPYAPPLKADLAAVNPASDAITAMTREDIPGSLEGDEHLPRHKGKKGRLGKLTVEQRDALVA